MAVLAGVFPNAAHAATTTFTATADAEINAGATSTNYGSRTTMHTDASPVTKSYLMFKVQGLTTPVTGATLRVWGLSSLSSGFDVRSVASTSWSESTITYANAPAASSTVTGSSGAVSTGAWASVPVKALVAGNGTYSFALTGSSSTALSLATKENSASLTAQLVVTTSDGNAPVNTQSPAISGTARDGSTLTADPGSWTGTAPINYSYQWQRCAAGASCTNIGGATGSTYTASGADVGAGLRVVVTAANAGGSATASSAQVGPVAAVAPANGQPPSISGLPVDGHTLTASTGAWTGTAPLALAYQWQRCDPLSSVCSDIPAATSQTYTLGGADVGHPLQVVVTASNGGGAASATSAPTDAVAAAAPVNEQPPATSGRARQGETLMADSGAWSGTDPLAFGYQWQRCDDTGTCGDIDAATQPTYDLTADDVGWSVRVAVTASNAAGSATAVSDATALVEPPPEPPVNTQQPAKTGTPVDGHVLTADPGTWTGTAPINYSYQWQRCDADGTCADIPGATEATYTLTPADVNDRVQVVVTATNDAGSASATSPSTVPVAAAPPAVSRPPAISGEAVDGATLSADPGDWTGTPPIDFAYQWRRCDALGCTPISGATDSTYTLTPDDIGDRVQVTVTASNEAGSAQLPSPATTVVGARVPSNTQAPFITGTALEGHALSADPGSWTGTPPIDYAYQWQRCDADGVGCADMAGATRATYTLAPNDAGGTVRVLVTASGPGGTSTASSATSAVVAWQPPVSTQAPGISGLPLDGQTLTADAGAWSGTPPLALEYRWQRCDALSGTCSDILGATASTYALTSDDVGTRVQVVVTATNGGGSDSATSAPTDPIGAVAPVSTQLPAIAGTAVDGSTLSADPGTWTGTTPMSFDYQWQLCDADSVCSDIAGQTGPTLALGPADIGSSFRVLVTANNSGGSSSVTSSAVGPVAMAPPANTTPPAISGSAHDGDTLSADPGSWSGTAPIAFAYQWRRCDTGGACADIDGATDAWYALTPDDVGWQVEVVVRASNDGGSASATSAPAGPVAALGPANTQAPTVSGTAVDGQTLSADPGTWTGTAPLAYAYQWRRCGSSGACVDIAGARAQSYTLVSADVGQRLEVAVTASNGGGAASATSAATDVVVPVAPANTGVPAINGTAEDGQTLSANPGTWSGTTPITYAYQWQRCDTSGSGCSDIAGATTSSYALSTTDLGSTLRVSVRATNIAGSLVALSAPSSVVVANAPENAALPAIQGAAQDANVVAATTGTWIGTAPIAYGYQWRRCDTSGGACADISGATTAMYTIGATDVGKTLRVQVRATNDAGSTTSLSAATATVTAAPSGNTTFTATADTEINAGATSTNYGTRTTMHTDTSPVTKSYLMFKVQGLTTPVTGATLRVWGLSSLSSGFEVRSVASTSWSESTITYANAPAASSTVSGSSGAVATGAWASVPVNALVTGNGSYSFALTGTSSTALSLATKENSATRTAQLVVSSSTPAQRPANTQPPVVTGTPRDGQALSADPGAWSGSAPLSFTYQWQRCDSNGSGCVNITGANSKTFALSSANVGTTLRALVTASNSAGTAVQSSAATATVQALAPANTAAPAISGTPQQALVLSASPGSWSGTTPMSFAYQWQRCDSSGAGCNAIPGATATAYTPVADDVGHALRVVVTASNGGGAVPATSAATAPVAPPPDPPSSTQAPTIAGLPVDGQTLTADQGGWAGTPPLTLSYRWQRCDGLTGACSDIPAAIAQTYTLVSADVGSRVQVVVTATNVAGSASATSAQTDAVAPVAPINDSLPPVSGSTVDGQTLTATPGAWHGTTPLGYAFQWRRCDTTGNCVDIGDATQSSYKLTSIDVGQTLVARVTARNVAGSTTADSRATSVIAAAKPANTGAPSISGTAQDGGTLNATTGSWSGTPTITYAYQWRRCDTTGGACADVSGATQSKYTAVPADVGRTLVVQVTATGPGGSSTAVSAPTATVAAQPPANTAAPTISGVALDGQTLTASPGTWTGTPTIAMAYQWQRCDALSGVCNDIATAIGQSYRLTSADVGYKMRVRVTGTNGGGSVAALSAQTASVGAVAPVNTAAPVVSGAPQPGQTLTTSSGSWSGTTPTYSYQWQRCNSTGAACTNISGQTANSYVVASGDQGSTLRASVTATNAAGTASAVSSVTAVVTNPPPTNTALPTISGTARDGQTLTAANGSWTGASSFAYQWRRCDAAGANCADMTGATAGTYLLTPNDVGSTVRVVVTASNSGGSTPATSAQTATVAAIPPSNTALPTITGTARDGQVLTGTNGSWTGTAPTYALQWRRCDTTGNACANIAGATAATYTLTPNDVGNTVRFQVTGTNSAGSTVATSAATAVVAALAPTNTAPPSVSGSTQQGQTIATTNGTWTGTPTITYAYQWRRCDTSGGTCSDVAGATSASYPLGTADVGKTMRVVVTASNSAGSSSATSPQTAVVSATGGDPMIAAAGDIACDPLTSNFNNGLGKNGNCEQKKTADLMVGKGYAAVLALGDNQYYCGGFDAFMGSYDLSWGLLKPITHPAVGNHEYITQSATDRTGCDATNDGAAGYFKYFGAAAGTAGQGYYSFDVGRWHLIALNSNCGDAGGCSSSTPQGKWLAADLAAHPNDCTLAYWHIPVYSSGGRAGTNATSLWTQLYNANADLVLSAHDHLYERFAPQDATGNLDTVRGMREFVVGTGGANHTSVASVAPNSERLNDQTYGVLELTLHPTSYDWNFRPVPGATFTDSGTTACH